MRIEEMIRWAEKGALTEIELLSMEGGFYLVRAMANGQWVTLTDAEGTAAHLRSTTQLKELLRGLPSCAPDIPCVLVQHVVHDEMCGLRSGPIEPLRVPVSLKSAW